MKTKRKTSGFFIVEILIVLVIIGILVAALLPNLQTYTQRAKFVDNINAAGALKPAVEGCILQTGTPGAAITTCVSGNNGVPNVVYNTTNVATVTSTAAGVITATGTAAVGASTYILTPTYSINGNISWAVTGSCLTAGLC